MKVHVLWPRTARLLAVLVIADGDWVETSTLRSICPLDEVGLVVRRLRRNHAAPIVGRSAFGGGYRLTGLPPDCCLDRVLDVVHELRRDPAITYWKVAA